MASMLFIQSPQKHNQRTFTGIYRKYSVLLNTNMKMLGLFQPTETRGRNTRKLDCLHLLFKNSASFQKTKKKLHRNYLCKTFNSE